jgi:hypothetical protein
MTNNQIFYFFFHTWILIFLLHFLLNKLSHDKHITIIFNKIKIYSKSIFIKSNNIWKWLRYSHKFNHIINQELFIILIKFINWNYELNVI